MSVKEVKLHWKKAIVTLENGKTVRFPMKNGQITGPSTSLWVSPAELSEARIAIYNALSDAR